MSKGRRKALKIGRVPSYFGLAAKNKNKTANQIGISFQQASRKKRQNNSINDVADTIEPITETLPKQIAATGIRSKVARSARGPCR